jgi:hypothetical protein
MIKRTGETLQQRGMGYTAILTQDHVKFQFRTYFKRLKEAKMCQNGRHAQFTVEPKNIDWGFGG